MIVRTNFVARHRGVIVECRHCFLMDIIVMSDRRSSDAGGRGAVERRWQEKLQNWKEELWAVHLVEERILIVIGRGVTAGP